MGTTAVAQVRDLPYAMACAYQYSWTTGSATITYSSLLSDYNNHDKPNGGDGVMDISTGQFTCLTAGHYTVTFSGRAEVQPGEQVWIYIYRNGVVVEESRWGSYSSSDGGRILTRDPGLCVTT